MNGISGAVKVCPTGADAPGSRRARLVPSPISDVGFRVGSFRSEILCPRGLVRASCPSCPSCHPDIMLKHGGSAGMARDERDRIFSTG